MVYLFRGFTGSRQVENAERHEVFKGWELRHHRDQCQLSESLEPADGSCQGYLELLVVATHAAHGVAEDADLSRLQKSANVLREAVLHARLIHEQHRQKACAFLALHGQLRDVVLLGVQEPCQRHHRRGCIGCHGYRQDVLCCDLRQEVLRVYSGWVIGRTGPSHVCGGLQEGRQIQAEAHQRLVSRLYPVSGLAQIPNSRASRRVFLVRKQAIIITSQ